MRMKRPGRFHGNRIPSATAAVKSTDPDKIARVGASGLFLAHRNLQAGSIVMTNIQVVAGSAKAGASDFTTAPVT